MAEKENIKEQLRRSLAGEAWHGPSLLEILTDCTPAQASARPFTNVHTIHEILCHVTANADLVLRRLQGDARSLEPDEDWPPVPSPIDEKTLKADIDQLQDVHEQLYSALDSLPESKLHEPVLRNFSTVYVTLHGLVQHNLYHAGQMAILKKVSET
jgi:uncharacterized damage-inducible protein DinB